MHRFSELSPPNAAAEEDQAVADRDGPSSRPRVVSQVDPELLQLEFRLGEGENEGFPEVRRAVRLPDLGGRCCRPSSCGIRVKTCAGHACTAVHSLTSWL